MEIKNEIVNRAFNDEFAKIAAFNLASSERGPGAIKGIKAMFQNWKAEEGRYNEVHKMWTEAQKGGYKGGINDFIRDTNPQLTAYFDNKHNKALNSAIKNLEKSEFSRWVDKNKGTLLTTGVLAGGAALGYDLYKKRKELNNTVTITMPVDKK